MKCPASLGLGKGSAKHNDRSLNVRDESKKSWHDELVERNIVHVNRPIKEAYKDIFGEALKKYNDGQIAKGRPGRVIKDYSEKIRRSKQEKESYEIVVEVGNTDLIGKGSEAELRTQKCLREYWSTFERRNPNFKVFQSIEHNDEDMIAHMHIQFVPISTNNKRGLETKVSLSGALREMGFGRSRDSFAQWRAREQQTLAKIMARHGLEFVKGESELPHMKMAVYKQMQREAHAEARQRLNNLRTYQRGKYGKNGEKRKTFTNPITGNKTIPLSEKEYTLMKDTLVELTVEADVIRQRYDLLIQQKDAEIKRLNGKLKASGADKLSRKNVKLMTDIELYKAKHQADTKEIKRLNNDLDFQSNRLATLEQQTADLEKKLGMWQAQNDTLVELLQALVEVMIKFGDRMIEAVRNRLGEAKFGELLKLQNKMIPVVGREHSK